MQKNYILKRKEIIFAIITMMVSFLHFSCNTVEHDGNANPFDSISVTIQNWSLFSMDNSGLPENEIRALAVDSKNNLWVGTVSSGIAMFNGSDWVQYNTSNSGLSDNYIQSITTGHNDNIWIGTSNGLSRFGDNKWTVYNTSNSPLPYRYVSSLAVDKNNLLWVGCSHFTAGGVLSFDGKNWELFTKDNSILPSSIIDDIYVDRNNNKWLGTPEGVVKIDKNKKWTVFTKLNSGLLFGVNTITADLDNNIWIGANEIFWLDYRHYYGGLQKFDGFSWNDYRPHPGGVRNPEAIVSNRVEHIICDRYGYLLIATSTEWEYPYNLSFFRNGLWENVTKLINDFPVNLFIRDMVIDKNNTLWLATQLGVISINYTSQ